MCVILFCLLTLAGIAYCDSDSFNNIITSENSFSSGGDHPVPGNGGIITATGINDEGLYLSWSGAYDRSTPTGDLDYRVYRSHFSNIGTVDEALANGTPLDEWITDSSSTYVAGLEGDTTYCFNVLVRDGDGMLSAYRQMSVSTLGTVYLYSAGPFQGNLTTHSGGAARDDIDSKCASIPVTGPARYRAFISISASDAVKDFPANYTVPTSWPVRAASFQLIAWTWGDLLDGSINIKLADAGISDMSWWSGSLDDGAFDENASCGNWTIVNNTETGRAGSHDSIAAIWINDVEALCYTHQRILCVAW